MQNMFSLWDSPPAAKIAVFVIHQETSCHDSRDMCTRWQRQVSPLQGGPKSQLKVEFFP